MMLDWMPTIFLSLDPGVGRFVILGGKKIIIKKKIVTNRKKERSYYTYPLSGNESDLNEIES